MIILSYWFYKHLQIFSAISPMNTVLLMIRLCAGFSEFSGSMLLPMVIISADGIY